MISLSRIQTAITAAIFIVALLCLGIQTVRIEGFKIWPISVKGYKAKLADAVKGRMDDRDAYRKAQAEAAAQNKAHVEAVERKQEAITNEVRNDLNSRLERIRRELRDNPAAKGSAGATDLPKSGPAPCRAFSEAWLCLSPADRLRAAENEERHDQLINWNERQAQ